MDLDPFEGFEASEDVFLHPAANTLFAQYIHPSDSFNPITKLQRLTLAECDLLLTRMGPFFKSSEPDHILPRPIAYQMVRMSNLLLSIIAFIKSSRPFTSDVFQNQSHTWNQITLP